MWNRAENQIEMYLIRHGSTVSNEEHRYLGQTEEPLSESGISKLQVQAGEWDPFAPELVFSSPLKRCRQSAQLLFPTVPVIVVPEWKEMNFGRFEGKNYEIVALADGETFFCEALPIAPYSYKVFDVIIELLINQGGKAQKGNARNYKIGEEKCDENTVVGAIGINYFKKSYGESTFDPVFIMAAVLEWAGIAHNLRGYIELTQEYKNKIYFR